MPLTLMYITNNPFVAKVAQKSGVDRIFADMEYIGKEKRQHNMDTVKNHHTVEDVKNLRKVITDSELLVRVNPLHDNSKNEIDSVISAGADRIMLPMWKSVEEVDEFFKIVDNRVKTTLLLENVEATQCVEKLASFTNDFEVHIGLNDLHISLNQKFLFEPLADGTVEKLSKSLNKNGIRFGIGGFGRIGEGILPAELIVSENYRLGSQVSILSRSFCDFNKVTDFENFESDFYDGVAKLRDYEKYICLQNSDFFENNRKELCNKVEKIVSGIK